MLFDTHAHYDDDAFDPDRELLLAPNLAKLHLFAPDTEQRINN